MIALRRMCLAQDWDIVPPAMPKLTMPLQPHKTSIEMALLS